MQMNFLIVLVLAWSNGKNRSPRKNNTLLILSRLAKKRMNYKAIKWVRKKKFFFGFDQSKQNLPQRTCSLSRNPCYLQHPVCKYNKRSLMYPQTGERYHVAQNVPAISTVGENDSPSQEFCKEGAKTEEAKH